jgi:hypothetical protein
MGHGWLIGNGSLIGDPGFIEHRSVLRYGTLDAGGASTACRHRRSVPIDPSGVLAARQSPDAALVEPFLFRGWAARSLSRAARGPG